MRIGNLYFKSNTNDSLAKWTVFKQIQSIYALVKTLLRSADRTIEEGLFL